MSTNRSALWIQFILVAAFVQPTWANRAPSNTSGRDSDPSLKELLVKTSQIGEGELEKTYGPETCQSGDLVIIDVDGSLTMKLGANALVVQITGIGKRVSKFSDRKCSSVVTTNLEDRHLEGVNEETCDGKTIVYHVAVEPYGNGLMYSRTVTRKGKIRSMDKVLTDETCKYRYAP